LLPLEIEIEKMSDLRVHGYSSELSSVQSNVDTIQSALSQSTTFGERSSPPLQYWSLIPPTQIWLRAKSFTFICTTGTYPSIDFGQFELPEFADFVSRQSFAINPPIDGVSGDAQVLANFLDGVPSLIHEIPCA